MSDSFTATRLKDRPALVELFAAANLAFLTLDIYVAHSFNEFAHGAEWIPLYFSVAGALVLAANLAVSAPVRAGRRRFSAGPGWWVGLVVGGLAILVGVSGLLWHLESQFFQQMTLRSLVYSAPFVAPLAFTGLGLLILLNRLVPPEEVEWGRWVLLLAWGGFVGNLVLSLVDHAQNGFFYASEWVPVAVAAITVGWLFFPIFFHVPRRYLKWSLLVLTVAGVTGVVGFGLHLMPALNEIDGTLWGRVVYGAPVFAPLLFTDLAVLGALATWDLMAREPTAGSPSGANGAAPPAAVG